MNKSSQIILLARLQTQWMLEQIRQDITLSHILSPTIGNSALLEEHADLTALLTELNNLKASGDAHATMLEKLVT